MRENAYQAYLIGELKARLPGCIVLKNDPNYLQGFPDLLVLHGNKWAALEVKASEGARAQPNQSYYVEILDEMSIAAFVYPENEEDVLDAIQSALESRRSSRLSKR